jgi:hypothetical protein
MSPTTTASITWPDQSSLRRAEPAPTSNVAKYPVRAHTVVIERFVIDVVTSTRRIPRRRASQAFGGAWWPYRYLTDNRRANETASSG